MYLYVTICNDIYINMYIYIYMYNNRVIYV